MGNRIIVINPNSSTEVTSGIDRALDDFRGDRDDEIECLTLAEGPPGIETQRHVDGVVMPLCRLVESQDNRASAFVIACYSDPGLHAVRETTAKPVFGIAESGLLTALTLGDQVGAQLGGNAEERRQRLLLDQMAIDRAHQAVVDLDVLRTEFLEGREARVAGADIVDREPVPERRQTCGQCSPVPTVAQGLIRPHRFFPQGSWQ